MRRLTARKFIISLWLTLGCLSGVTSAIGCGDNSAVSTAEQRNLGDIELNNNLSFSLSPGTIDQHTQDSVKARASVPLPQFSLSTGPTASQTARITLANIHRDASIRVIRNAPLTSRNMPNCPTETPEEAVVCRETPDHPTCVPPALTRSGAKRSEASLIVELDGCTRRSFTVDRGDSETDEDAAEEMRLAVLGRAKSLNELRRALAAATADKPDFVLLLGDAVENSSLNGLRDLDFMLRTLDFPTVVLPGEDELVDGSRTRFLEVFGPLDFGWELGHVHFYAFYTATAELNDNGLNRLRNVFGRMDPNHPTLLFTHTPPIDPLGPRDQGFRSQIQAARLLSLISDSTVDAFFVGHINDSATMDINSIKMHLSSVERSAEYLSVQVKGDIISVTRRSL